MTVFRQPMPPRPPGHANLPSQHIVLAVVFLSPPERAVWHRRCKYSGKHPTKEIIMKLQFGQNQLVLELSDSPFAWFHGETERMSLTSLSLLFVQFSLFARQPAA
jgi:hypothetical protein